MSNWLDLSSSSNRFIRMYVQGFVDISGGNLIVRNSDVSFNNRLYVGGNVSVGRNIEVSGITRITNNFNNKKIVVYDSSANEPVSNANLFYGFGVNTSTLRYQVDSSGAVHKFYFGNSTTTSQIAFGGISSPSYNATSDYRIKANIILLSDTSYTVDLLKPVTYINSSIGKQDIGFIAHELNEQLPFLVNGEKDGEDYQTVNYTGLVGLLTKEIQDLKREVRNIRKELAAYKQ